MEFSNKNRNSAGANRMSPDTSGQVLTLIKSFGAGKWLALEDEYG